ncbi:MAG: glycoside hydrolase, partial [Proteiniphilum sp.]
RLFILEYALLFNVTLRDYLEATGDRETALSLWPVAKRHKEVSLQGVSIFALEQSYHLARLLGKEDELKHLPMLIRKMKKAAHVNYFDKKSGLFKGLLNPQISYASQIWMILSGVASREEAEQALVALEQMEDACKPGTPYLYHYYIEALIESGLNTKAREKMIDYWGGMIQKGADTFWEAYDPEDDFLSPYNFFPINSYCHAWSCTPVYFIRKYPKIFQNRS